MKKKDHIYNTILKGFFLFLLSLSFLLSSVGTSRAGDDDVPFFVGSTGLPNVLFIFDNSDSMQDVPYLRKDGSTLRPSWRWRYGVTIDTDGTIAEDSNGHVIYDYTKYVDTSTTMNIPSKTPPPLPGVGSLTSTITRTDIAYRIYDSNIDWTDSVMTNSDTFNATYRYYKVEVKDANGATQYRTITGRSTSGGYWNFYRPNGDADNLDFSGPGPYTYTIVPTAPGEVTYPYHRSDRIGRYVFDANVDWSVVYPDRSNYYNKLLVVTAGTNAGESRRISWLSSSGYWYVDPAFSQDCDYTTRYKIVGSPDDDRYAYGGNHPASKLYQAKKALNQFLDSDAIKVCAEHDANGNCTQYHYVLNMGFATYMSARIPRVRAKYYRKIKGTTTTTPERYYIRALYKRTTNHNTYVYTANSDSEFTAWGVTHTGVTVGYTFDRLYHEGECDEQTITYTVTAIEAAPTDSLPNRHRFRFNGDYVQYSWRNVDVDYCDVSATPTPPAQSGWTVVDTSDPCYQAPTCHYVPEQTTTTSDYYQTTNRDTYGDYNVTDPADAKYIDRNTLMVTPYPGFQGTSWTVKDNPDPDAGDWTLVTSTISGVPINSDGDTGDIEPNTFDHSYFRYPGVGTDDRPHGWSYKKTADGYVYRYSSSYASTWGDAIQSDPYFPASVGDEKANHTGDDQVVFVNLPEYSDTADYKGDDVTGQNLSKIKNYISLARVTYPGDTRYDETMMPYTDSLAVNSSQAVAGKGTPLAATLEDAKKYYESYIAQDGYTQGGCRDNYIILLTDGLETCDGDPVQAATDLLNLTVGGESYPVKTYVIGFGLDSASQATLNAIAAAGGTSHAYFANNVEDLVDILVEDITSDIISSSYTRSTPVITALHSATDDLRLYVAYFDYPTWRGHLKAYELNKSDGTITGPVTAWAGDCDSDGNIDADAGCEIKLHGRGTVYTTVATGLSPTRIEFSTANVASLKSFVNPDGDDINSNGTADENADAEAVISHVLDPGFNSGHYAGTRDPEWPLGDIYHSSPVVVTKPSFSIPDSSFPGYSGFKTDQSTRSTLLYVGANDGMIHGINASNGQEAWAYIPKAVLTKLHELSDGHRFTVDLPIKAADIYSAGGTGTPWSEVASGDERHGWHTVIVGGLRQGGYSYFAIDVTDPTDPQPLWEFTDSNMGKTWSTPSFGRINVNGTNKYVVFVGGGISTDENKGNRVYIIDVATGTSLKEITVGTSTNNVPSELLVVRNNNDGDPLYGNISAVYFGDTNGTLWKLTDLNADSGWNPTLEALFVPTNPRPIFHKPAYYHLTKGCDKTFILFGTGDEQHPTDSSTYDYFYEIEDRALTGSETTVDRMNWQESFPQGEKLLSDPVAYLGTVYFTTYQPQGGCDMGNSYLYGLTISTCNTAGDQPGIQYDENGNPLNPYLKKIHLGRSIATSVALGPPYAHVGTSSGGGHGVAMKSFKVPTISKLIYWKEAF